LVEILTIWSGMNFKEWYENHREKQKTIVQKLAHLSDEELMEYFEYENMRVKERDFCPLYSQEKKCHDIEKLNCFFCACPEFNFVNEKESFCSIGSRFGKKIEFNGGFLQDCSKCFIAHKRGFIRRYIKKFR
jgi:Zn-finger protein